MVSHSTKSHSEQIHFNSAPQEISHKSKSFDERSSHNMAQRLIPSQLNQVYIINYWIIPGFLPWFYTQISKVRIKWNYKLIVFKLTRANMYLLWIKKTQTISWTKFQTMIPQLVSKITTNEKEERKYNTAPHKGKGPYENISANITQHTTNHKFLNKYRYNVKNTNGYWTALISSKKSGITTTYF